VRRFQESYGRLWWVAAIAVLVYGSMAASASANAPRGYELVSPAAEKDVMADSARVRTADTEAPGLPMAAVFPSLGGFSDVRGTGVAVDYLASRDGKSGTSGWTTHAITPPQEPLTFGALVQKFDPLYLGEMAPDLSRGIFRSWSPLDDTVNVQEVPNLYLRNDLRTPGAGAYQLLTAAVFPLSPASQASDLPFLAGASTDLTHILYESRRNLTADASGRATKLYKADQGTLRLIRAEASGCPTIQSAIPCSIGGSSSTTNKLSPHVISDDGRRVNFSSPFVNDGTGAAPSGTIGVATALFQLDDGGTISTADDAVVEVSTSEKAVPDVTQAATYKTASADGGRVFFTSGEQLTDDRAGGGLYMWARQPTDETQSLVVDATGGTFTLTFRSQVTVGAGTLTNGSTVVTDVTAGSFSIGQTLSGPGIPDGTTIVSMGSFGSPFSRTLTLSAPATADVTETLTASVDATTPSLVWNAAASEVQTALEGLTGIGAGNVSVTGGPGGSAPFEITFTGALAGVDVAQLTSDSTGLVGGAGEATVTTSGPVQNLTLLASDGGQLIGASEDGHRVYFFAGGQLVPGGPPVPDLGLFMWEDADGTPGGTLSFIGGLPGGDNFTNALGRDWSLLRVTSALTPDGRYLVFEASGGSGLAPGYIHGACDLNANRGGDGCSEVYVYSADESTPLNPHVVCASCDLSVPGAPEDTQLRVREHTSAASTTGRLSRVITDDGQHVFFDTPEALVPEDTNGRGDAYEFDVATGRVHLISSGTDPSDSYFMETTPSGDDVFFVTRERLVGWDRDQSYDLYDARVGGGFPEPVPARAECSGDECQGQPPAVPGLEGLGSSLLRGLGNPRASLTRHRTHGRRCKRRHVKRRVHGRVRCVRRSHRATRHVRARNGSSR
jgi:hypothetical protein